MSSNGGGVNGGVSIQDKFMAMRRDMSSALIERDGEIDMALTAIVAREHCLFVGIPGCLHPDTPIHDPFDDTTLSVSDRERRGVPFHVKSYDHKTKQAVIAMA